MYKDYRNGMFKKQYHLLLKQSGSFIHVFMAKVLWQIVQYRRQNGTVHQMNHLLSNTRDIFLIDQIQNQVKFLNFPLMLLS